LGLNATTPELETKPNHPKLNQINSNQTPRPTSPLHVAIVKGPLRSTSKAGIDVERCALPWCASVGDMSPEALEAERSKHLPACRRCRVRKIKCNRGAPKCANCTSSNAACIIVDPITSEQYPRDYIRELEERERQLRANLDASPSHASSAPLAPLEPLEPLETDQDTPNSLAPTVSAYRNSAFVGDGSGLRYELAPVLLLTSPLILSPQLPSPYPVRCKVAGLQTPNSPSSCRAEPDSRTRCIGQCPAVR
jgi:hypothetical protein